MEESGVSLGMGRNIMRVMFKMVRRMKSSFVELRWQRGIIKFVTGELFLKIYLMISVIEII